MSNQLKKVRSNKKRLNTQVAIKTVEFESLRLGVALASSVGNRSNDRKEFANSLVQESKDRAKKFISRELAHHAR